MTSLICISSVLPRGKKKPYDIIRFLRIFIPFKWYAMQGFHTAPQKSLTLVIGSFFSPFLTFYITYFVSAWKSWSFFPLALALFLLINISAFIVVHISKCHRLKRNILLNWDSIFFVVISARLFQHAALVDELHEHISTHIRVHSDTYRNNLSKKTNPAILPGKSAAKAC